MIMLQRFVIILFICASTFSHAQEEDELDVVIEQEQVNVEEIADEKVENLSIKSVSGLEKLVPFNDLAVIQKRYLPRTGRFEFFPNMGLILNDAFFFSSLYGARFSYHLSERWGIEFTYLGASTSSKKVTDDLERELVKTDSLLIPESYMGLDLKWIPIYGKMALSNRTIIPYDFYFSFGGGSLETNQKDAAMAIHLGVGQSFAITQAIAFRWDTSFYWYSSDVETTNGTDSGSFMNLHLTLGASFFFPEAKYR
jgi:outer membrane beta-barrel protein